MLGVLMVISGCLLIILITIIYQMISGLLENNIKGSFINYLLF